MTTIITNSILHTCKLLRVFTTQKTRNYVSPLCIIADFTTCCGIILQHVKILNRYIVHLSRVNYASINTNKFLKSHRDFDWHCADWTNFRILSTVKMHFLIYKLGISQHLFMFSSVSNSRISCFVTQVLHTVF